MREAKGNQPRNAKYSDVFSEFLQQRNPPEDTTRRIVETLIQHTSAREVSVYYRSSSTPDRLSCVERLVAGDDKPKAAPRNPLEPPRSIEILASLTSLRPNEEYTSPNGARYFPVHFDGRVTGAVRIVSKSISSTEREAVLDATKALSLNGILYEAFKSLSIDFQPGNITESSAQYLAQIIESIRSDFGAAAAQVLEYRSEQASYQSIMRDRSEFSDPLYLNEHLISNKFTQMMQNDIARLDVDQTLSRGAWYGFFLNPNSALSRVCAVFLVDGFVGEGVYLESLRMRARYYQHLFRINQIISADKSVRSLAVEDRSVRLAVEVARIYKHRSINKSEDLRSRLKQIKTRVEKAAKRIDKSSAKRNKEREEINEALGYCDDAFRILSELNGELENITKWRKIKKVPKEVSVSAIWERVMSELSDRFDRDGVDVSFEGDANVVTYGDYLEHALLTFCVNSLDAFDRSKVARKKSRRKIRVKVSEDKRNVLRLVYYDTAGGIDLRRVSRADGDPISDIQEVLEGGVSSSGGENRGYGLVVVASYVADHPDSRVFVSNEDNGIKIDLKLTGFPPSVDVLQIEDGGSDG